MKKYNLWRSIFTALVAGFIGAGVIYLSTVLLGDAFETWAANFFYQTTEQFTGPGGRIFEVAAFQWQILYRIFYIALGILIFLWVLTLNLVRTHTRKATQRQVVQELAILLDSPLENRGKEYPEIQLKIQKIQDAFQHKEQLLQAESTRKDDLVAYLAHDLKTPLTSVIGYLELLEGAPDMPIPQRAKYTHVALEKAYRLEHLISDFFEITRYNIHEILVEWEKIDLTYMLIQMKEEFYPVLNNGKNDLQLDVPEGITVSADREKLGRVLSNILKNAVAYSYPNSTITIKAEQTAKETLIVISNQGKTIPKQKLEHIFEKFYRLDEARNSNSGGAGLGLAIAKEIILAHGGSIQAESENEVTSFTVRLPNLRNSLAVS